DTPSCSFFPERLNDVAFESEDKLPVPAQGMNREVLISCRNDVSRLQRSRQYTKRNTPLARPQYLGDRKAQYFQSALPYKRTLQGPQWIAPDHSISRP
ncbi:hypothetical protein BaRGS_00027748, partial [Batillaria attramentaria]